MEFIIEEQIKHMNKMQKNNTLHYKYYDVLEIIKKKIEALKNYDVYIFITTDEKPFIEFMTNHFKNKVIFYEKSHRSEINTQFVNTDFTNIPTRNIKYDINLLTEENKKSFIQRDTLINNSIHLGNKIFQIIKKV